MGIKNACVEQGQNTATSIVLECRQLTKRPQEEVGLSAFSPCYSPLLINGKCHVSPFTVFSL